MKLAIDYFNEIQSEQNFGFSISDGAQTIQKEELNKLIDQYVSIIHSKRQNDQVQCGVAICLRRSIYYIAAMIASWKAGAYFIPLNIRWPEEKINDVLASCKPDVIFIEDDFEYDLENSVSISDVLNKQSTDVFYLDNKPSDLAYIIYTSGSTGKPKGVMINHLAYASYIDWTKRYFSRYANNKKLVISAELTFDITMGDLAFALAFGTEVHVAPDPRNIVSLYKMIKERNIDTFYSVPTTINAIYRFAERKKGADLSTIKLVLSGGDVFSIDLVKTIKNVTPDVHFYNVYGPTEMTINCFAARLDNQIENISNKGRIPIGNNFDIIDYAIINEEGVDVARRGDKGKLCVLGPQTMLGYLNDLETTRKSFVPDIRYPEFNRYMYNTNDIAMLDDDGQVYLFGRADHLVKIKGYRIHPDEVTRVVREIKNVYEATTIAVDIDKQLELYLFVQGKTGSIDIENIQEQMKTRLPDYMIPSKIINVQKMPYNDAGKIDKIKLREYLDE